MAVTTGWSKPWIANHWKQSGSQADLDLAGGPKISLHQSSLMSPSTPDLDAGLTFGTAPVGSASEITGTGWASGGTALTSPAVTIDSTNHAVVFTANAVTIGTGVVISSNFDTAFIYQNSSNIGLFIFALGTQYQLATGDQLTITWQATPITNTVFYGA